MEVQVVKVTVPDDLRSDTRPGLSGPQAMKWVTGHIYEINQMFLWKICYRKKREFTTTTGLGEFHRKGSDHFDTKKTHNLFLGQRYHQLFWS